MYTSNQYVGMSLLLYYCAIFISNSRSNVNKSSVRKESVYKYLVTTLLLTFLFYHRVGKLNTSLFALKAARYTHRNTEYDHFTYSLISWFFLQQGGEAEHATVRSKRLLDTVVDYDVLDDAGASALSIYGPCLLYTSHVSRIHIYIWVMSLIYLCVDVAQAVTKKESSCMYT